MRCFLEEYCNFPQGADLNATTPLRPFSRHVAGDGLCEPCVLWLTSSVRARGRGLRRRYFSVNLPNFLICGVAQSGTSHLAEMLAAHPQVYLARPLVPEPHFFYFSEYRHRDLGWYRARWFADADGFLAVGEKSTSYMLDAAVESLVCVPVAWGDYMMLQRPVRWQLPRAAADGAHVRCVVLNLHPVHVFLNTTSLAHYARAKNAYHEPRRLAGFRAEGTPGVRTFLESFLHDVSQRQASIITAAEVASRFLHEQDSAP